MKNKVNSQPISISINNINNIDLLIKRLKSSLNAQKDFLKEIDSKLSILLQNKKNKNVNEISLVKKLISILPEIILRLGIPFAYFFLRNENILEKFINIHYEQNDEKISKVYEACLEVFSFSLYYNYINQIKHYLIEMGIIKNKDQYTNTNPVNTEQSIFERISSMLNELTELKNIGIDRDNFSKLQKDYNDILKEIRDLHAQIKAYPALIEFYEELIKPFADYLKPINKNKNKKKEKFNNFEEHNDKIENNFFNREIEQIMNTPLENRTSFFLNEKLKEKSNQVIEFKNYSFPLAQKDVEDIKFELCSFLNTLGGRLYIGINDQNVVKGVNLNYKKRDNLRNYLINLTYDFYPKCRLDKILVYFIPLKEMNTKNFIKKKYIIKIRVYPGEPEALYSITNKGYTSTVRINGKCCQLNSTGIYKEIIDRDKYKNMKKDDKTQFILKESQIKDPEPEINQEDLEDDDDDIPAFENNNLKKIIIEKGSSSKKHYGKKRIKNMVREGTITVKVTNIDESISLNEVNKFFNKCKCATQKFFPSGYGYLNFSSMLEANNCLLNYEGAKIGNKIIKLNIINND